jgi:hypothetical protein
VPFYIILSTSHFSVGGCRLATFRIRKTYTQARYIFPLTRPPLFPASLLFPYLVLLIASTVFSYLSIYLSMYLFVLPATRSSKTNRIFFRYSRDTWVESPRGRAVWELESFSRNFGGRFLGASICFLYFFSFSFLFLFFSWCVKGSGKKAWYRKMGFRTGQGCFPYRQTGSEGWVMIISVRQLSLPNIKAAHLTLGGPF